MTGFKDEARALRYRRLALVERDPSTAALLRKLADEAEQGLLCTSRRMGESDLPLDELRNRRTERE